MKLRGRQHAADSQSSAEMRRWLIASAIVVLAHAAGVASGFIWQKPRTMQGDAPPAVLVELAPLAVAPEPTEMDIAPGPQMTEAIPEDQPLAKPEEKLETPEIPEKKEAEVVLPPPVPEKKEEEKQKQEVVMQKQERKDRQKHQAPQTTAPPKLKLKRAERPAANAAGSTQESAYANANWRGAVVAHLNRFKRFPGGANSGTAVVAFSIDAAGRVTSARLARSSGNGMLDGEAVAMVRRASPVPAPPVSVSRGGGVTLSVPVRFVR